MGASSMESKRPKVAVVMGSRSDYSTMKEAVEVLAQFSVPYEELVLSAHRTPERLRDYAQSAEGRGIRTIIAGAGGAAHLPGMLAAETLLPVFGVPIKTTALDGLDALLSIAQMPRGVPVATLSIGGAANAALFAVAVLAGSDAKLKKRLIKFREIQTQSVPLKPFDDNRINGNLNGGLNSHDLKNQDDALVAHKATRGTKEERGIDASSKGTKDTPISARA